MITPASNVQAIKTVSQTQSLAIENFMQGAIYTWSKNFPKKAFAVRDLVGGENYDWHGTPLIALYDAHKQLGESDVDAVSHAAQDLGWIVKKVLTNDKRNYVNTKQDKVNYYKWVGNEP